MMWLARMQLTVISLRYTTLLINLLLKWLTHPSLPIKRILSKSSMGRLSKCKATIRSFKNRQMSKQLLKS